MRTAVRILLVVGITFALMDSFKLTSATAAADKSPHSINYTAAVSRLESAVKAEMADHQLHGISLALVDDQRLVYCGAIGNVKRDSIFRAGSVSKLFNALAVMQLVEQKKLDLDAPISNYGPQFSLVVPFDNAPEITLRHLLCHRSGMIRESPVGSYFDSTQPSLAETVASIRSCVLVNPPNTKTRYSNIGPSIAGQIAAIVSGQDYAAYQSEHILKPLGMTSSSFMLSGIENERLAPATMQVANGHGGFSERPAPVFNLGTVPAGNLFTTAEDLARFVSMLAAEGRVAGKEIVSPASLQKMWTPQLVKEETGYGVAFMAGKFRNHKTVSHNGAVYGFSTAVVFLPDAKLGVVVLSNDDIVNGNVGRLANQALALMLEAKLGETPPDVPKSMTLSPEALAPFAGEYESPATWAELEVKDGRLAGKLAGQSVEFKPVDLLKFSVTGRTADGAIATFQQDTSGKATSFTTAAGQTFTRVDPAASKPTCPLWDQYKGTYGPSFIPLVISTRHGHLYAMTENVADYRLMPVNRNVFAFPAGLYADEHLIFLTGLDGKVTGVNMANMILPRN